MVMNVNDSQLYADVNQLQNLKKPGEINSKESLERVAKEFESIYLKMMLDSMRAAEKIWSKDNPFSSQETEFFRDMLDGQITKDLAVQKSIGLADMLVQQLAPFVDAAEKSEIDKSKPVSTEQQPIQQQPIQQPANTLNPDISQSVPSPLDQPVSQAADTKWQGDPAEFIKRLMPAAKEAGAQLNVDPKLLVAQAALETGWGKSLNNQTGSNLFGIKSTGQWQGSAELAQTKEYIGGRWLNIQEDFRAYASPEDSFKDYVQLIQKNQRYTSALNAKSSEEYVDSLQQAGYATDPNYSQKVLAVYQSPKFQSLAAEDIGPLAWK